MGKPREKSPVIRESSFTLRLFRAAWYLPLLVLSLSGARPASAQQPAATEAQTNIAAINTEMNDAIAKVRAIVNQPVTRYVRKPGMRVSTSSPGWFHEGALKPYFPNVDVRFTQQLIYDKHEYVTSDLNPGVVFIGRQLEFNSMTKYFYTDYSVPKKKLSEQEMVEINRLYKVIGRCEQQLARLRRRELPEPKKTESEPAPEPTRRPIPQSN